MRDKRRVWQNKRPSWDRRITWYQGDYPDRIDIRLKVEYETGQYNLFFTDREQALEAYTKFKEGVNP